VAFTYNITAINAPITGYNASSGIVSGTGLSVNTSTGVITGTVTSSTTLTGTISATNSIGTTTQPITMTFI